MSETAVTAAEVRSAQVATAVKSDVLDQLLKPEVQEALTVLVDQLPKLAEMMGMMSKMYALAQQVAGDRVLIEDMVGGIKEVVKPLEVKVKGYASAAIEASDRAEQNDATIGLFGMLRLLKDPELQRLLRFGQAYLDVLGERRSQE